MDEKQLAMLKLLGEDNFERLRGSITDSLIDLVQQEFDGRGDYLFNDDFLSEWANEIMEECKSEVKGIIKQKILNNALGDYGIK